MATFVQWELNGHICFCMMGWSNQFPVGSKPIGSKCLVSTIKTSLFQLNNAYVKIYIKINYQSIKSDKLFRNLYQKSCKETHLLLVTDRYLSCFSKK